MKLIYLIIAIVFFANCKQVVNNIEEHSTTEVIEGMVSESDQQANLKIETGFEEEVKVLESNLNQVKEKPKFDLPFIGKRWFSSASYFGSGGSGTLFFVEIMENRDVYFGSQSRNETGLEKPVSTYAGKYDDIMLCKSLGFDCLSERFKITTKYIYGVSLKGEILRNNECCYINTNFPDISDSETCECIYELDTKGWE